MRWLGGKPIVFSVALLPGFANVWGGVGGGAFNPAGARVSGAHVGASRKAGGTAMD
jgi:hypothetical protein